jgi:carboxylesterase type B
MQQADKEKTAVLNAGLHDVRESLRWLHRNVVSFGGDPDSITIWGESAGANAVATQLLANSGKTEGLFARAIMQSGSQST